MARRSVHAAGTIKWLPSGSTTISSRSAVRTDPRPRRQADKDLHADRQSSLAELDPNLPTEIAKPSPLAQSWNEFDHALDAHIANAALTS